MSVVGFGVDAEAGMKRFVEGEDRRQATLLPECIDDYVSEGTQPAVSSPARSRRAN